MGLADVLVAVGDAEIALYVIRHEHGGQLNTHYHMEQD